MKTPTEALAAAQRLHAFLRAFYRETPELRAREEMLFADLSATVAQCAKLLRHIDAENPAAPGNMAELIERISALEADSAHIKELLTDLGGVNME